jgi:tetratricopeptide (TPR) repeat protein
MKKFFIIYVLLILSATTLSLLSQEDPLGYYFKGIKKEAEENYQGAIEDLNKCIELDPDFYDAFLSRGNDKLTIGDNQGAIEDFNIVINNFKKKDIQYTGACISRGQAKYRLGDLRGAIADFNKAIENKKNIEPKDLSFIYTKRGFAKGKLKDFKSSINDFNMALKIDPNNSEAFFGRGCSKYSINDVNGACLDWSKAGELGDSQAYDNIHKYCQ